MVKKILAAGILFVVIFVFGLTIGFVAKRFLPTSGITSLNTATIITRVHTAEGVVGEVYNGDEFETQAEVVKIILDEIQPLIVGRDASGNLTTSFGAAVQVARASDRPRGRYCQTRMRKVNNLSVWPGNSPALASSVRFSNGKSAA